MGWGAGETPAQCLLELPKQSGPWLPPKTSERCPPTPPASFTEQEAEAQSSGMRQVKSGKANGRRALQPKFQRSGRHDKGKNGPQEAEETLPAPGGQGLEGAVEPPAGSRKGWRQGRGKALSPSLAPRESPGGFQLFMCTLCRHCRPLPASPGQSKA